MIAIASSTQFKATAGSRYRSPSLPHCYLQYPGSVDHAGTTYGTWPTASTTAFGSAALGGIFLPVTGTGGGFTIFRSWQLAGIWFRIEARLQPQGGAQSKLSWEIFVNWESARFRAEGL